MNYVSVYVKLPEASPEKLEIVIAELFDAGFEGFLETSTGVAAYIPEDLFNKLNLSQLHFMRNPEFGQVGFEKEFIIEKNWNELWESNYEPVLIQKKIIVRTPFHKIKEKYDLEVIIEPKMSFGTGHHETTALMMEQMLATDMANKNVLDMGCGTGILSILALLMGAESVIAVDLNEWACENTRENVMKNHVGNIQVLSGDSSIISGRKFDIILANITKNVLIEDIPVYSKSLVSKGHLIMSGILAVDSEEIKKTCNAAGLIFEADQQKKDWIAVKFKKN